MGRKPKKTIDAVEAYRARMSLSGMTDKERLEKVRQEFMTSPDWEDYPCRYCTTVKDVPGCSNRCNDYKAWFKVHWRQMRAGGSG